MKESKQDWKDKAISTCILLFIVVPFVLIGYLEWSEGTEEENIEFHEKIDKEVFTVVKEYKKSGNIKHIDSNISIHDKCLIVGNAFRNYEHKSSGKEYKKIYVDPTIGDIIIPKANHRTESFTVFFVEKYKLGTIGNYTTYIDDQPAGGKIPAYQARFDVYVVYWPSREVVGMHSIISNPPYKTSYAKEVVGDQKDVYLWISELYSTRTK